MKAATPKRLLLLQIRDDPQVRREEHESFARYCGLDLEHIDVHNVFDQPTFNMDITRGYDALLVGGASEASVSDPQRYTFVPACIALLQDCVRDGFPVFASCFGFQLAVLALGGTIVKDEKGFEMGSIPISLRAAARTDALMRDVPDPFMAIAVHRERSIACPPGAIELAYTAPCSHAFRVIDKPFWAFQFHPEVDRSCLIERLTIFKHEYTDGDQHLDEVLSTAVETPWSNGLLKSFVDRIV